MWRGTRRWGREQEVTDAGQQKHQWNSSHTHSRVSHLFGSRKNTRANFPSKNQKRFLYICKTYENHRDFDLFTFGWGNWYHRGQNRVSQITQHSQLVLHTWYHQPEQNLLITPFLVLATKWTSKCQPQHLKHCVSVPPGRKTKCKNKRCVRPADPETATPTVPGMTDTYTGRLWQAWVIFNDNFLCFLQVLFSS